jgi:hypothetical protein
MDWCRCGCPSIVHVELYGDRGQQVGGCQRCDICERFEPVVQEAGAS